VVRLGRATRSPAGTSHQARQCAGSSTPRG
jgi:hypothetical protein